MDENKRLYGKTSVIDIEQLEVTFSRFDYVVLAVLFGSRALGQARPGSDYDFAVLFSDGFCFDWGAMAELRADLAERLGLPDKDFDIVDLGRADRAVLSGIAKGYSLLKGEENELQRILEENGCNRCRRTDSS